MGNEESTIKEILSFLSSEDKFLLLTGTYQDRKHVLALSCIIKDYPALVNILFRVNIMSSAESYLAPLLSIPSNPKSGTPFNIKGGHKLFIDSINKQSWVSSPKQIDVAVVYPIDALDQSTYDNCIQDLMNKDAKKILLISWTDNGDFSWVNHYNPTRVVYDAEEDNPDYHQGVLESISSTTREDRLPNLPKYAQSTPTNRLIQILCRKCNSSRWASLNRDFPGMDALKKANTGDYIATCLKCGNEAIDNYKWYR